MMSPEGGPRTPCGGKPYLGFDSLVTIKQCCSPTTVSVVTSTRGSDIIAGLARSSRVMIIMSAGPGGAVAP